MNSLALATTSALSPAISALSPAISSAVQSNLCTVIDGNLTFMTAAFLAGLAVHALWTRAHSPAVQEAPATSEKKQEVVMREPRKTRTWEARNFSPKTHVVFESSRPYLYDPFDLLFYDPFLGLDFQLFDLFIDLGFGPSQWERLFQEMPPMRYQLIEQVHPRHITKKSQPAPFTF